MRGNYKISSLIVQFKLKKSLVSSNGLQVVRCVHVLHCAISLVPHSLFHAMDIASDAEPSTRIVNP